MSGVEQPTRPSFGHKVGSTVLVFVVPLPLLTIGAVLGGSVLLGTLEVSLLLALWTVGLIWVWRPRRS